MWMLYAIGASVFWGLMYVFDGKLFKYLSVPTTLFIHYLVLTLTVGTIAYFSGAWRNDIATIESSTNVQYLLVVGSVVFVIAELMIAYSIAGKNATLASIIEISYPLFIALFSYLIFKENTVSYATALGGMFVLVGVSIIYWFEA